MDIPKLGTPEFTRMLNNLIKLQIQMDTTDKMLKMFVGSLRDAMEIDATHKNCEQKGCRKRFCMDCGGMYFHEESCSMGNGGWINCGEEYDGQIMLCEKCKENAPNQSQQNNTPATTSEGENKRGKVIKGLHENHLDDNTPDSVVNIHTEIKKEIEKDYTYANDCIRCTTSELDDAIDKCVKENEGVKNE